MNLPRANAGVKRLGTMAGTHAPACQLQQRCRSATPEGPTLWTLKVNGALDLSMFSAIIFVCSACVHTYWMLSSLFKLLSARQCGEADVLVMNLSLPLYALPPNRTVSHVHNQKRARELRILYYWIMKKNKTTNRTQINVAEVCNERKSQM